MTIATTILSQIGGLGKLSAMVGATLFTDLGDGLRFRFKGSRKANCLVVRLDPSDTYTVTFYRIRNVNVTETATFSNVYADQLRELFTNHTGLYLSL